MTNILNIENFHAIAALEIKSFWGVDIALEYIKNLTKAHKINHRSELKITNFVACHGSNWDNRDFKDRGGEG